MKRRIFIKFKEKIIDYIKYNQFNATKTYNKKFRVSKRVMCSHPLLHLLHSCELEQGVVIIQNLAHKGGGCNSRFASRSQLASAKYHIT